MFNDPRRIYHDRPSTWTSRRAQWDARWESLPHILGHLLAVAVGVAFLLITVTSIGDPYNQTNEFLHVQQCGDGLDCFERHEVLVVGRDIETRTWSDGDPPISHTTTDYMITWQHPDGSRSAQEVSPELYRNAQEGQPATLRMWRGHDVAITAGTETYWFVAPGAAEGAFWLVVGAVGLALTAWGSRPLLPWARWAWQMRRERSRDTRAR